MSQDENAALTPEDITPEAIEAADRKTLDHMAAVLGVELPNRIRIDSLKVLLTKTVNGEAVDDETEQEPIAPAGEPLDTSADARQDRRDQLKARRAARSEKRRLRNKKTGRIFVWTPALAKHKDMVPAADAE